MTQQIDLLRNLGDFCTFPQKPIKILQEFLEQQGTILSDAELIEEIKQDWERSVDNKLYYYDGNTIIFPIRYKGNNSFPIEISLRRNSCKENYLFLYYVNLDTLEKALKPLQKFENFAFLGTWASYLTELSMIAMKEPWEFKQRTHDKPYDVLAQYLKCTFYRLQCENKIVVSEDGSLAAFNTGLVDPWYNDIYAFFVPNTGITEWKAGGFGTVASSGRGKQLLSEFKTLPQRASYVQDLMSLLPSKSSKILVDWKHVIIDNIDRFPIEFLKPIVSGYKDAYDIICAHENDMSNKDIVDHLRDCISTTTGIFTAIQTQMQAAIEYSLKRIAHDYRTAIPSYYPRGNKLAFLIPLFLSNDREPSVALVVEGLGSSKYQGHTILTLEQAYIDARTVGPLTGTWLESVVF